METTKTFIKEEIIFQQGEKSKYAYIIESGKVGIYKENNYGKRSLIGILKKSALYGEMGLNDKSPLTASAKALAHAFPIPFPAPVTKAIFFLRFIFLRYISK